MQIDYLSYHIIASWSRPLEMVTCHLDSYMESVKKQTYGGGRNLAFSRPDVMMFEVTNFGILKV